MQQILLDLAQNIRDVDTEIARLHTLLEHVSSCEHFTEDEVHVIREKIAADTTLRNNKAMMLRDKLEVYENQVQHLEDALNIRKKIIDEQCPATSADELMDVFKQNQVSMTTNLEQARAFLRS